MMDPVIGGPRFGAHQSFSECQYRGAGVNCSAYEKSVGLGTKQKNRANKNHAVGAWPEMDDRQKL